MLNVPCLNCPDRCVGCHSTCAKYKDFRATCDAANEARRGNIPQRSLGGPGRQNQKRRPPVWAEREAEMTYKVFVSYRRPGEGIRWKIFRASTVKNANAGVELIAESAIVYYVRIERCG